MNKLLIFILILSFNSIAFSQDIDIFQKNKNDNFKYENISPQMSYSEYQILSRNLRMKEMLYSMIVPGYVHFYAKENKYGYGILALRTIAYGEIAYMTLTDRVDFSLISTKRLKLNKDDIPKTDIYLTYGAIGVVVGTYLFDWIHGHYILKRKQEKIRYKYNMKMNLSLINNNKGTLLPGVTFNFQF